MFDRFRITGRALGAARFIGLLGGVALTLVCAASGVMALAHGPFVSYGCRPPTKMAKGLVREADVALLEFQIDNGRCPTRDDLTGGKYVNARGLVDPWGTSIAYWCHGMDVAVRSAGPDKLFNTDDDITNQ